MGLFIDVGRGRIEAGRSAFNRGAYFEAHELWEEVWKELDGAGRIFVQGLIQIAAGLHHLQQRRARPAAALLHKGLEKVSREALAPPGGLRIAALVRDVAQLLAELEAPDAPDARLPEPRPFTL